MFSQQKDTFNQAVKIIGEDTRSMFSNYVLKLSHCGKEQRRGSLTTHKKGVLKDIMQSTSSESIHTSNTVTPSSFRQSKFTGVKDPSPLKGEPERPYSHGLYKPRSLLSSKKLVQKVETREKFVEDIDSILTDKERSLFAHFENLRVNLLKHSEWFRDIEGQKGAYLMLTELEESWLQGFIKTEFNTLTKEKNKLEEELKSQPPEKSLSKPLF
jgi:hypothetical protein